MRFSRRHRVRNSDEAVLPLTNIVFLLLIFFMLAGQFAVPQHTLDITPPHSASNAQTRPGSLEVDLAANGQLALNGKPIKLADLGKAVRAQLQQQPDLALQLKADGKEDASRVVVVMHVLHDAGAHKLRLLTIHKAG